MQTSTLPTDLHLQPLKLNAFSFYILFLTVCMCGSVCTHMCVHGCPCVWSPDIWDTLGAVVISGYELPDVLRVKCRSSERVACTFVHTVTLTHTHTLLHIHTYVHEHLYTYVHIFTLPHMYHTCTHNCVYIKRVMA